MNFRELDEKYIAKTYARFPINLVSGKGAILTDDEGKQYIDLGSGIAVNTFGASDQIWIDAVTAQLNRLQHTSNLYYTLPDVQLAQMLCERTGMKKVFFSNSGAEANECAIKAARQWSDNTKGSDHSTIITLTDSFHGRTITTLAATGQDHYHHHFLPLTPGFVYAETGNIRDLEEIVAKTQGCAIMIEIIQGEGGVIPLSVEFIEAVKRIAQENELLVIVDEIQTGNGRTGQLYAYMNFDLQPDIVTTAKGLAGGLPLGATLLGERVQDVFTPGSHGSTFGGNPVCCAGAVSVLSRIDDELLKDVREKSAWIQENLRNAAGVNALTGMGFMLGIDPVKPVAEILKGCREKGVLVLSAKQRVRLLPPLSIPWDQLEKAINILKEVLAV